LGMSRNFAINKIAEQVAGAYEFNCSWKKCYFTAVELINEYEIDRAGHSLAAYIVNLAKTNWAWKEFHAKKAISETR